MKEVSVVIPVYNNSKGLATLLRALLIQTYPKKYFEIVIVDNGSKDGTLEVARDFQSKTNGLIEVLTENSIQSSYAARNRGIMNSQREVIAFIDSDCFPIPEWIEKGVSALEDQDADLIGGRIKFLFPTKASAADIYDSLTYMQMKTVIEIHGSAPTANLFVLRRVFDKVGLFPQNLRSGGDIILTGRATRAGFKLKYAPEVLVTHPTRGLLELIKKKYRTAGGHLQIWQSEGIGGREALKRFLRYLFPPRPILIARLIEERGSSDMKKHFWSIWLIAWLCRYVVNLGRFRSVLSTDRFRGAKL